MKGKQSGRKRRKEREKYIVARRKEREVEKGGETKGAGGKREREIGVKKRSTRSCIPADGARVTKESQREPRIFPLVFSVNLTT